jgi:hypothetical protein
MKKNTFPKAAGRVAGLLAVLLVVGLGLAGCPTESDSGGGIPDKLADNASYDDTVAKVDEIIEYCDDNPGTMNDAVKTALGTIKTSLTTGTTYSANWSSVGASMVASVNGYIDVLE